MTWLMTQVCINQSRYLTHNHIQKLSVVHFLRVADICKYSKFRRSEFARSPSIDGWSIFVPDIFSSFTASTTQEIRCEIILFRERRKKLRTGNKSAIAAMVLGALLAYSAASYYAKRKGIQVEDVFSWGVCSCSRNNSTSDNEEEWIDPSHSNDLLFQSNYSNISQRNERNDDPKHQRGQQIRCIPSR
jgi:hypothetical protein